MGSQAVDSQIVWVGRQKLADELGIGRRRVGQLVDKGIIIETELGIDLERAVGAYHQKTDPSKRAAYVQRKANEGRPAKVGARVEATAKPKAPSPTASSQQSDVGGDDGDLFGPVDYNKERARREAANARIAELNLASKEKNLVSREEVRDKEFAVARLLRDRILGFPARIANLIPADAMKAITDECKQLVRELQDEASKIAEG